MVALRSFIKGSGVQFVMTAGISMMLKWFVANLVFATPPLRHRAQITVRDLILFGWIMSAARETKLRCLTAHMQDGVLRTVVITRTPV